MTIAKEISNRAERPNLKWAEMMRSLPAELSAHFMTDEDFLSRITLPGKMQEYPPLDLIAIPTKGRAEALGNCLESIVADPAVGTRNLSILISDASDGEVEAASTRATIESIAAKSSISFIYLGERYKRLVSQRLIKENIPSDVVKFCLSIGQGFQNHYGANRNLILLATIGHRVLGCDDDVMFYGPDESNTNRIECFDHHDPYEYDWHSDHDSCLSDTVPNCNSILSFHGAFLGATVPQIVKDPRTDHSKSCECIVLNALTGQGYVSVTTMGTLGSPTTLSPLPLLFSCRRKLPLNENNNGLQIDQLASTLKVKRFVHKAAFGHRTPFLAAVYGFDNSRLLPPFFPIGRGEDSLWGKLLSESGVDFFMHLPSTTLHQRPKAHRGYSISAPAAFRQTQIVDLLQECLGHALLGRTHASLDRQMNDFSAFLSTTATLSTRSFTSFLNGLRRSQAKRHLDKISSYLDGKYTLYEWQRDSLKECRSSVESALCEESLWIPVEAQMKQTDTIAKALKEKFRLYAQLLNYWPLMREVTKDIDWVKLSSKL
ncbi:MAG: hypothetical protein M3O31_09620 [Acidobacteriota bacterium]|nr:hypothetical protein [Acidobacteriota bacterium]